MSLDMTRRPNMQETESRAAVTEYIVGSIHAKNGMEMRQRHGPLPLPLPPSSSVGGVCMGPPGDLWCEGIPKTRLMRCCVAHSSSQWCLLEDSRGSRPSQEGGRLGSGRSGARENGKKKGGREHEFAGIANLQRAERLDAGSSGGPRQEHGIVVALNTPTRENGNLKVGWMDMVGPQPVETVEAGQHSTTHATDLGFLTIR